MGSSTEIPLFLIDGYNLLHSVILRGKERPHWWSVDNQARVVSLVSLRSGSEECWVVFDARRADSSRLELVTSDRVHYASSADDWIVVQAEKQSERSVTVVSADRALVDRARRFGAKGMSPWQFAESCTM